MGSKTFKRRLVHGVALIIMTWNNFVLLLKSFITNVLKYKAQQNLKCVCITMCSLVMSLFSRDYIETEIG